jgi:hypothetical protein
MRTDINDWRGEPRSPFITSASKEIAMKRFRNSFLAQALTVLLALVFTLPAPQVKASALPASTPAFSMGFAPAASKTYRTAFASAARTTTANSEAFDVGDSTNLVAYLSVTAASGTTPTLDVKFQDSPDGGTTWFDIAGLAFTQATGATSEVKVATRVYSKTVRCVATIAGTTPSFTFSVRFFFS